MAVTYIGNAFSLGMVQSCDLTRVRIQPACVPSAAGRKRLISCVGHADTARVLGVEFCRISVLLERGDKLIVAQLQGGRLPEGSTELPDGFSFTWVQVEVLL